jgi:hypothetical protein
VSDLVRRGQLDLDAVESDEPALATLRGYERRGVVTDVGVDVSRLPTGADDEDIEECRSLLKVFGRGLRGAEWGIGDVFRYAKGRWGEAAWDIADAAGVEPGTITSYVTPCERIPLHERVPGLGLSIHRLVSRMEPGERRAWLAKAKHGDDGVQWTRERLRWELGAAGVMSEISADSGTGSHVPAGDLLRLIDLGRAARDLLDAVEVEPDTAGFVRVPLLHSRMRVENGCVIVKVAEEFVAPLDQRGNVSGVAKRVEAARADERARRSPHRRRNPDPSRRGARRCARTERKEMSGGIAFELRDNGATALTASGVLRLNRTEFRSLLAVAEKPDTEGRLSLLADIVVGNHDPTCAVCTHPSCDLIDMWLRAGASRQEIQDRLNGSEVPSSAELGRHEQEQHGRPWREQPPGDEPDEEPPGWWSALDQGLRERGVDLSNRRSWKRLTRVPGCEVCSSSDRVAIEKAMRRRSLFRVAGDYSTSTWRLREHRKHM